MKLKNLLYLTCIFIFYSVYPTNFVEYFNAGIKAYQEKNYGIAIEQFQYALELDQDSIDAHYNLAFILKLQGNMQESLPHYRYVLSKKNDHCSAHIGFAQACLATGDYEEGWQELEWRMGCLQPHVKAMKEYIHNKYPLINKKILVRAEWGIGDTIMFLRYAQLLHEKGAQVMIHPLHHSLVPLLKLQPYIQVVPPDQNPPPFHFEIPMVSLPYIFGTSVATIPSPASYIACDETLTEHWKEKLSHDKNFKIGICWRGNIIHGEEKFMPLHYYVQLAHIPGVSLYSLQKHHGLDQLAALKDQNLITCFDDSFDTIPFFDTAGIMKNLDLIITTDTSIAHLAGALGLPTWVILHHPTEWRWMLDRSDSPWYPSMRLFRQEKNGGWQKLFIELVCALEKKLKQKKLDQ